MKFLFIISTVIALSDSTCPVPSTCPCGEFKKSSQVEIHPGGSGCYQNLSCPGKYSFASTFGNTTNNPLAAGEKLVNVYAYTGDNLMDLYGIKCEYGTWYITKFPYAAVIQIVESGEYTDIGTYKWDENGYTAVLDGFECYGSG